MKTIAKILIPIIFGVGLGGCMNQSSEKPKEKEDRVIFTDERNISYHLINYGEDDLIDAVELRKDPLAREIIHSVLYAPYAEKKVNYAVRETREMTAPENQLFQLLYVNLNALEKQNY